MLMFLFSQSDLPRYVAYNSKDIVIPFLLLLLKYVLKRGICLLRLCLPSSNYSCTKVDI